MNIAGYQKIDPSRIPAGIGLEGVHCGAANFQVGRPALRIRPGERFKAKLTWPGGVTSIPVYVIGYNKKDMNGRQRKILDKVIRRIGRDKIRQRRRDEHEGVMRIVI